MKDVIGIILFVTGIIVLLTSITVLAYLEFGLAGATIIPSIVAILIGAAITNNDMGTGL